VELLFEEFLRERRYPHNLSENTFIYHREVFNNFRNTGFTDFSSKNLAEVIIKLRARGITPSGVNTYIRGINVFLKWLHENGPVEPSARP